MKREEMEKLVDRVSGLAEVAAFVASAPWVALDTEADSLHAYPEKLCLIQVSVAGRDALVDPLAGVDLGPLLGALAGHELILHGADYDLRLLHRTYGFVPGAVFDTMIAARLAGRNEVGLEKLALSILGLRLEKGAQRANWARRPLTDRMVAYALNDTRHLKAIRDALAAELEGLGRLSWHREACARMVKEAVEVRPPDPDEVWRVNGASRLERRALAVLKALWHWRDGEARRLGKPPFFVLSHDHLLRVADAVGRGQAWTGQLPRKFPSVQHAAMQGVVERALELREEEWPRHRRAVGLRLTVGQRNRHVQLVQLRDRRALELGLEPSLIASRATLVELAAGKLDPEKDLMGWQRQVLGV